MAVLPLEYVAYCVSLMTNKPHFKKTKDKVKYFKRKHKTLMFKMDIAQQSPESQTTVQQLRIWPVDYNKIATAYLEI